jgi:hypothetical protein
VLLTELLSHPVAARCGLRRLAPTVLVSTLSLATLLDEVRGAGFLPVAEGADGAVVDLRAGARRASVGTRSHRRGTEPRTPSPPTPTEDQLVALVARVRAGDAAARTAGGATADLGAVSTGATLELLRDAADAGNTVCIGYVDSHGIAVRRIVRPLSVAGGMLEGIDRRAEELRRFPLHRITSAALLPD